MMVKVGSPMSHGKRTINQLIAATMASVGLAVGGVLTPTMAPTALAADNSDYVAEAMAKIDAAQNLLAEQKRTYKERLNGADCLNMSTNAGPCDTAPVEAILKNALAMDSLLGGAANADAQGAKSSADVEAARAAIEAYKNVDVTSYVAAVDSATSVADVAAAIIAAREAAQQAAADAIGKYTKLMAEQKASYQESLKTTVEASDITHLVENAGIMDAVQGGDMDNAGKDNAPAGADRIAAKAAIAAFKNLSTADSEKYATQADVAGTLSELAGVMPEALKTAKENATAALKDLNYLGEEQQATYTASVDGATGPSTINEVMDEAARKNAKNHIDALLNLSDEEKTAAKRQIDEAPDPGRVSSICTTQISRNTTRFGDSLIEAKDAVAAANNAKSGLRYLNASDNAKKTFDEKLAALENLITRADDEGLEAISAGQLTAAANDVTAAQTALDGQNFLHISLPVIGAIALGIAGVGAAAWYANQQNSAPAPGTADAGTNAAPGTAVTSTPVAPQPAPAPVSAPARGQLASTGSNAGLTALLALALIAIGGLTTAYRRREI